MSCEQRYETYSYSDYFRTDLPSHWKTKRLGFLAQEDRTSFVDGPFGSDLKTSDYIDNGVPLIQLNNIRDSKHLLHNMKYVTDKKKQELIRHLTVPGDVVIAKMADPVARSAVVSDSYAEYVIVADCVKMSPNLNLVDLSYLVWAINCDCVRINAELVSTGTTRIRISLGELKKLKIPYPLIQEQQAIANFLDHETAKIDTLIEKQQLLIKLLKEKRQAVISHAVTKGLNPNAPMRDSGIEWLGEVPEHWERVTFKYLLEMLVDNRGRTPPTYGKGIPLLEAKQIDGSLKYASANFDKFIDEAGHKGFIRDDVQEGDILFITVGTIGKTCLVSDSPEFVIAQNIVALRTLESCNSLFLLFWLRSLVARECMLSTNKDSILDSIKISDFVQSRLYIPPILEQQNIATFLDQEIVKIDDLIEKANSAITLMQERRTALISAAVTGKIDVRGM